MPDLDRTNLVVGRIVSGAALVDDLAAMPAVKATHDNPFFKCALRDHLLVIIRWRRCCLAVPGATDDVG